MSEDCARLVWRSGQHGAGAGSTASSFSSSGNVSVRVFCGKKHLVQITLKGCVAPVWKRETQHKRVAWLVHSILFSNF